VLCAPHLSRRSWQANEAMWTVCHAEMLLWQSHRGVAMSIHKEDHTEQVYAAMRRQTAQAAAKRLRVASASTRRGGYSMMDTGTPGPRACASNGFMA
jgi:hypothetical protein